MSGTREEALEEVVRAGSVDRCLSFFEHMPERERRKLAPVAARLLRERESGPFVVCQRVAVLATASLIELKRLGFEVLSIGRWYDLDPEFRALENRRPDWIAAWATWLLDRQPWHWTFLRQLEKNGLWEAPDSDAYVLAMASNLVGYKDNVLEVLRDDPALLPLVWRLFVVEGFTPLVPGSSSEFYSEERSWEYALQELSKKGELSRKRLLDASLDALQRDFPKPQAAWYTRFHEYMKPTVEERAARADRYLDLLANPMPPTVTFAVRALQILHKKGRLDGAAFAARAEPPLYTGTESVARPILAMLDDIASKEPALAGGAAQAATAGLEHKASEIQETALAMIERHGDAEDETLPAAVADRLPVMAPAVRARAAAWLPLGEAGGAPEDTNDIGDLRRRALALPRRAATRSGVSATLAELDSPAGSIPAIRGTGAWGKLRVSRVSIRRFLSFCAIVLLLSPFLLIAFFRGKYKDFSRITPSNEEKRLNEILRMLRSPLLRPFHRLIPRTVFTSVMFETLDRFDTSGTAYEGIPGEYELLMDPGLPMTTDAVLMTANGLGFFDPEQGQIATDVLIRAIDDGRLDGGRLGTAMRALLSVGHIKPNRWAERLATVAAESPLHAQVVRNAQVLALPGIPEGVRNIHTLVELLFDLCVEAEETIADPDCRAILEGFTGTGKAAKLAKKLLSLNPGDPLPHRRAAATIALRGRVERAERWAGRQ